MNLGRGTRSEAGGEGRGDGHLERAAVTYVTTDSASGTDASATIARTMLRSVSRDFVACTPVVAKAVLVRWWTEQRTRLAATAHLADSGGLHGSNGLQVAEYLALP